MQVIISNAVKHFTLGPKAIITDPCYDRKGIGDYMAIVNTQPGQWFAEVIKEDGRIGILRAWFKERRPQWGAGTKLPITIGVDSGQAGIFCDSIYPTSIKEGKKDWDLPEWVYGNPEGHYGKHCNLTSEADGWGTLERSVCSGTAYGDGGYDAFVFTDSKGLVYGIEIHFIDDPEEEEE